MLVIKDVQMEAFRQIEVEKFVQKSVVFLRQNFADWCADKEQEEIEVFIHKIIAFGEQYEIRKQLNLQKLMHFKITYEFDIPLVEHLEEILTPVDTNESYRVKCFYKSLLNKELPIKSAEKGEELDWWE